MQMSQGVEWATHCLYLLALLPGGRALSASRLAQFHDVPAPYLTKHLQALVRAGILDSVPGPRGGFRLNRATTEITLLDVVVAVDGPKPAFRCAEIRQQGPSAVSKSCYEKPCGIAAAFARADAMWRSALRDTTLGHLIDNVPNTVDPKQLEKTETWLERVLR